MPRQLAFVHHPFALFNQPHLLSRPYSTQLLGWDAVFVCVAKIRTSDSAGHHRHIRFILSMCLHHIPRVWRTFYLEIMCLKPHSRCAGSRFSCFDCRRVLCLLVCVCVCVSRIEECEWGRWTKCWRRWDNVRSPISRDAHDALSLPLPSTYSVVNACAKSYPTHNPPTTTIPFQYTARAWYVCVSCGQQKSECCWLTNVLAFGKRYMISYDRCAVSSFSNMEWGTKRTVHWLYICAAKIGVEKEKRTKFVISAHSHSRCAGCVRNDDRFTQGDGCRGYYRCAAIYSSQWMACGCETMTNGISSISLAMPSEVRCGCREAISIKMRALYIVDLGASLAISWWKYIDTRSW